MDPRDARSRAVVDANVIVYTLLETRTFQQEVLQFWRRTGRVSAPSLWEAEVVNALWGAHRSGIIDGNEGLSRIIRAQELAIMTVPVHDLWQGAFVLAAAHDHPAYDTMYVELARRLDVPLATFDERLLEKFPGTAVRPGDV